MLFEEHETALDAEEFKNERDIKRPQLVMNLPKGVQPSTLAKLIEIIGDGNGGDGILDD